MGIVSVRCALRENHWTGEDVDARGSSLVSILQLFFRVMWVVCAIG